MKTLIELRRRLSEILAEQAEIDKTETEAKRNYLENEKYIALQTEERSVMAEIDTAEKAAADRKRREEAATAARSASAGLEGQPPAQGSGARAEDNGEKKPFDNFGDFLLSVRSAADPLRQIDPRLHKFDLRRAEVRAATGMNETVLQDGGFLVAQETSMELIKRAHDAATILPRTTLIPLGAKSNGIKLPYVDETSRVNGSRWGGVRVYWADEAEQKTASKPKLGRMELNLKKLVGLCYTTDELEEDAVSLGAFMEMAFTEEFAYVLDDSVIRGTGAGTMLGILNSPARVTVSKESGQAAATIVYLNIIKMLSRLHSRALANAAWFINPDAIVQLAQMTVPVKNVAGTENVGGSAVYQPANGAADAPFGRLMGLPVIPIEQASALGTEGDIILADFSQYLRIQRQLQTASSIHVRFIYDESVYRFVQRIDGQPAWKTALTPANGGSTVSPFVTLATRS